MNIKEKKKQLYKYTEERGMPSGTAKNFVSFVLQLYDAREKGDTVQYVEIRGYLHKYFSTGVIEAENGELLFHLLM